MYLYRDEAGVSLTDIWPSLCKISSVQLYGLYYVVSFPSDKWFQLVSNGFDIQHGSPALAYWFACGWMSNLPDCLCYAAEK